MSDISKCKRHLEQPEQTLITIHFNTVDVHMYYVTEINCIYLDVLSLKICYFLNNYADICK